LSEGRASALPLLPPQHLVLGCYLTHHVAGLASPVASEASELSPGMAPHWGTTECFKRIVYLLTLSYRSLLSIISTHFPSPARVFIIDHVALELRAPDTFRHTLNGLLLVWHPRLQVCAGIVDARVSICSLLSAVGELSPIRWRFSGIGGRLVYRLLLCALLTTGRCMSPDMEVLQPTMSGTDGLRLVGSLLRGASCPAAMFLSQVSSTL
jgi:hypothetical protein